MKPFSHRDNLIKAAQPKIKKGEVRLNKYPNHLLNTAINPLENKLLMKFREDVARPIARGMTAIGLKPITLTTLGLITGLAAGVLVGLQNLPLGALFLIISMLCDALDGPLARFQDASTPFGAFIDSVFDRYVDFVLFAGIAWFYLSQGDQLLGLLSLLTILGALTTSYSKARAEALKTEVRTIGLMPRAIRLILALLGLLFPPILPIILWILAILSNLTAVQRIIIYSRKLHHPYTTG